MNELCEDLLEIIIKKLKPYQIKQLNQLSKFINVFCRPYLWKVLINKDTPLYIIEKYGYYFEKIEEFEEYYYDLKFDYEVISKYCNNPSMFTSGSVYRIFKGLEAYKYLIELSLIENEIRNFSYKFFLNYKRFLEYMIRNTPLIRSLNISIDSLEKELFGLEVLKKYVYIDSLSSKDISYKLTLEILKNICNYNCVELDCEYKTIQTYLSSVKISSIKSLKIGCGCIQKINKQGNFFKEFNFPYLRELIVDNSDSKFLTKPIIDFPNFSIKSLCICYVNSDYIFHIFKNLPNLEILKYKVCYTNPHEDLLEYRPKKLKKLKFTEYKENTVVYEGLYQNLKSITCDNIYSAICTKIFTNVKKFTFTLDDRIKKNYPSPSYNINTVYVRINRYKIHYSDYQKIMLIFPNIKTLCISFSGQITDKFMILNERVNLLKKRYRFYYSQQRRLIKYDKLDKDLLGNQLTEMAYSLYFRKSFEYPNVDFFMFDHN